MCLDLYFVILYLTLFPFDFNVIHSNFQFNNNFVYSRSKIYYSTINDN